MRRTSFFVFLVLGVMLAVVAQSIITADWMPGLHVLLLPALAGLLAGTLLSISNFPGWTAHITSAIYGTFVVGLIGVTHASIKQTLEWRERVLVLADKVGSWLYAALNNGTSRESVIFVLVLCALFWLLGYTAAWYSFRYRRIWHVVLPAGVTVFSNAYYYGGSQPLEPFLVIYLICALILLVESHLSDREEQWAVEHVRFGGGLRWRSTLAGFGIAALALVTASQLPNAMRSPTAQEFFAQANQPYSEFMARWNRLFSTLRNYNLRPVDNYLSTVTLGGPRNLTEDLVMQIAAPPNQRYYWRAASYDTYDGINWSNGPKEPVELDPNEPLPTQADYAKRKDIQIQVALNRGTDALYTPGTPRRADVPSQGLTENSGTELMQLKLNVPLLPGNRFSSIGSLSSATIEDLRGSRPVYPAWITQRYLQVPGNVPRRVRDLARNIGGRFTTPYERALAVESWLRQNIVYDENLEAPPTNREASDYILFDTKRAYCTYYSTAMVVMLRTLGVPSRIVTGYAQGEFDIEGPDSPTADYTVRVRDSHVWVEVWFPEYGWIPFEPTAAQPQIDRVTEAQAALTPTPGPSPTPGPTPEPEDLDSLRDREALEDNAPDGGADLSATLDAVAGALRDVAPLVLGALALFLASFFGVRLAETSGLSKLPPVQRVYGMLSRWATWLGIGANNTPYEQAKRIGERVPTASGTADTITRTYVEQRFSRRSKVDLRSELDVEDAWRKTRAELRKEWLLARLRALRFWRKG